MPNFTADRRIRFVIHHSAAADRPTADLQTYRDWHINGRGWSDIGYHYVVERIGDRYEVLAGRPLWRNGSHAPGVNRTHIGVCFAGNFNEAAPNELQLDAGVDLIVGLACLTNCYPLIEPHWTYKQTDCPGKLFPLGEFISLVERQCERILGWPLGDRTVEPI